MSRFTIQLQSSHGARCRFRMETPRTHVLLVVLLSSQGNWQQITWSKVSEAGEGIWDNHTCPLKEVVQNIKEDQVPRLDWNRVVWGTSGALNSWDRTWVKRRKEVLGPWQGEGCCTQAGSVLHLVIVGSMRSRRDKSCFCWGKISPGCSVGRNPWSVSLRKLLFYPWIPWILLAKILSYERC